MSKYYPYKMPIEEGFKLTSNIEVGSVDQTFYQQKLEKPLYLTNISFDIQLALEVGNQFFLVPQKPSINII